MNINRGFETMIPKENQKEITPTFYNQIKFKLFGRVITFNLEVKKDV
jgi:hypothetical protein